MTLEPCSTETYGRVWLLDSYDVSAATYKAIQHTRCWDHSFGAHKKLKWSYCFMFFQEMKASILRRNGGLMLGNRRSHTIVEIFW